MAQCSVLIGGDIYPAGKNATAFEDGDVDTLFGPVISVLDAADYVVANLECPLTDAEAPIVKTGPNFRASPRSAMTLRAAGIDAVSLANNHIMDQGATGLRDTIQACADAGLRFFGAGLGLASAQEPLSVVIGGLSIAFLGVAEHEFSIASASTWGASPLDIMWFVPFIRERKHEFDHLIVLLHGGNEHYPLPSPKLQRVARFLVEEGASAVVCQHSHHVGAIEIVNGSPIVYGQGNFLFAGRRGGEEWRRGFLVELALSNDAPTEHRVIPFFQRHEAPGLRAMTRDEEALLRSQIEAWSAIVRDEEELLGRWVDFCEERSRTYFSMLRGHNRYLRFADRFLGLSERLFGRKPIPMLLNLFRCEAHREALITLLESRYKAWYQTDSGEGER